MIRHVAEQYAAPTLGPTGRPDEGWLPSDTTDVEWGDLKVRVWPDGLGGGAGSVTWDFEADVADLTPFSSDCVITQVATPTFGGSAGAASLEAGSADASNGHMSAFAEVSVIEAVEYTATVQARAATVAGDVHLSLRWLDSGYGYLGTTNGSATPDETGDWVEATVTATAPADAAIAFVLMYVDVAGAGETHYFDDLTLSWGAGAAPLDITTVNGVPTVIESYELVEPYGCGPAAFTLPAVTGYTAHTYDWLRAGVDVDIYYVDTDDVEHVLWCGLLGRPKPGRTGTRIAAWGDLTGEAGARMWQPPMLSDDLDIGSWIARGLDPESYTRPYPGFRFAFSSTDTGILSRNKGQRNQRLLDYVDQMLALAQDGDGQWTVSRTYSDTDEVQPRSYYLRRKGAIQTSTVAYGGRGIVDDLDTDDTFTPTTIYGEGLDPQTKERWRNKKVPGLGATPPPDYPTRDVGSPRTGDVQPDDTDADFTTPSVITRMQAQMLQVGFGGDITGTYDDETALAVGRVQDWHGLPFANEVDEDTWEAIYATDGQPVDYNASFFAPIATTGAVEPYLFFSDGSIKGLNPDFDPTRLRVETAIHYQKCKKNRAAANARTQLARDADGGGLVGTVVLEDGISPWERHAYAIREGGRFVMEHYLGGDLALHIARVFVEPQAKRVTLNVSERAYDLQALSVMIARIEEARTDPASSWRARNEESKQWGSVTGWDKESGAGVIPLTHLSPGWNAMPFLASESGTIATIKAWTTDDPTRYCIAIFNTDVDTGDLATLIPDPLAEDTDGYGWWSHPDNEDQLDDWGLTAAWGQYGDACGYSPGKESQSDPSPPVTGRFKDDQSWGYASNDGFLHMRVFVEDECDLRARMKIQTDD